MRLFGSLFGWDQSMEAINAVMAYHYLERSDVDARKKVAREVARIIQSVNRHREEGESDARAESGSDGSEGDDLWDQIPKVNLGPKRQKQ